MKKLNIEILKERVDSITSENLLKSITGGVENTCHDGTIIIKGPVSGEIRTDGTIIIKH